MIITYSHKRLTLKLYNPQLNELKSAVKSGASLSLSSDIIGDSNDKTNFPHKSLLTERQVSKLLKPLANN